jgi:Putative zinc-finger
MECNQIREHLSAYLDGVLDAATRQIVAGHLHKCHTCRAELNDLQSLVSAMGDLESVKAPPDFLEQLHTRMTPMYRIRKWLKNLFLPFRLKWPVQLTTALAMGVLIFFITQTIPIQQQTEKARLEVALQEVKEEKTAKAPQSPPALSFEYSEGQIESKVEPPKPEAAAITKDTQPMKMAMEKKVRAKAKSAPKPLGASTPAPPPTMAQSKAAPRPEPLELALMVRPMEAPAAGVLADKKQVDHTADEQLSQPRAESKSPRLGANLAKNMTAGESLPISPRKKALFQVRQLLEALGGKVLSVEHDDLPTHQPETLLVELPAAEFNALTAGLQKIAPLRRPLPDLSPDKTKRIQVRIHMILP